jgi:CRISPR/Cas system CSM-associated protein Csm3 (group 7 of RAMP superfamily)
MHRFNAGTATFHLTITPQGPWMVRGQTEQESFTNNKGQPDRRDVLAPLLDHFDRPYIPGSSLKGVLRNTAERILRSMHPNRDLAWVPLADDPFVHDQGKLPDQRGEIADSELDQWLKKRPKEWFDAHPAYQKLMNKGRTDLAPDLARHVYPLLSPASQLFGCTLHAGLLTIDAARANKSERQRRSHVAVDRFSGGVGAGPFVEDLAAGGVILATRIQITNFALWQVALLGLTIQELNRGYQAIGGGTRKGQGRVQLKVERVEFAYTSLIYPDNETGVVSAQARLAEEHWVNRVFDVPPIVQRVESAKRLLPELEPQTADWRGDGLRILLVQEANVKQLFQEASRDAWQPWVGALCERDSAV